MAIVYFYSNDGESIVTLDSETSITYSQSNTATSSSVMSGASVSDGFIEGNVTVNMSGVVTYSKSPRQASRNPNPDEFQRHLDELVRNKTRFTLYTNKRGRTLINDLENCVITSRSVTVDRFEDTITVSLSFESIFVSDAAKVTLLPPLKAEDVRAGLADNKDGNVGTKTVVTPEETSTYLRASADSLSGVITNLTGKGLLE